MEVSYIDVILFAPIAPILGVLLFWFIQLLFIESYKSFLQKIKRKHMPLCRFTNFIGILFQTICHALGYTTTLSGISHFYVSVHEGKVKPKKEKTGIFEWISNSFLFLGPFFIPPFLLLLSLFFLINTDAYYIPSGTYSSFGQGLISFGNSLHSFSEGFLSFLFSIDLLHPGHLGFFLLLLFLGMGIRPSYMGEDKRRKVDMIFDLQNIKSHIFQKPLYLLLLFLFSYCLFYVSFLLDQNFYLIIFSVFGWLSIIAITALIISHLIVFLIKITDEIPGKTRVVPFFSLPLSYAFMRAFFYFTWKDFQFINTASLLFMAFLCILITYLLLKFKTNKFKTKINMKQLRVEDGPR